MEEHGVTQTEHMATIEAHAVAQQVQQVHVATYTEHSMLSADEDSPSSPEDTSYDDSDILNSTAADEVTAHLAAAGPVGMAAAAAVATGKKRKRPHVFESNPSIRKRQQTRLLRKLRATLDEYTTRVGQQAIVLCISPSKPNPVFKVFGAAPLENVVRKYKSMILEDLESALAEHAPAPQEVNSELPPLTIDGIPVSVDKMTQAQLRAFIPEMLKYSTGRGKPGWGKESCKPIWWPEDIPWANVRSDVRTEEQKQRVSWTQALRTIVKNCYKQHGREDLLYAFEDQQTQTQATTTHSIAHLVPSQTVVQTFSNPDGTVSLIQVGTGATVATLADASELPTTVTVAQVNYSAVADGEVEQNWATLQGGEMTIQTTQASEATQAVASLAEAAVAASQEMQQGATVTMALNSNQSSLTSSSSLLVKGHGSLLLYPILCSLTDQKQQDNCLQQEEIKSRRPVKKRQSSEAAAHAVATLAEATLQGGGQIVLSGETAAAVGALTGVQDANGVITGSTQFWKTPRGLVQIPVSMYQTVVTSLAQGNGPVQVAMAPVTTRISDSAVTMDGQAVEVVTLEQ
ncbi:nuclear respiratory factor 1 isoform X1 [Lagenorhynchus albirostris]|uniref:Nuclear respiratory factor 1 isoform X1 n=2 Tax=Delphinidae TaxID=9726 RepID=A0A2U4AFG1_TURTR|nr:nuclear respiratory factor 1 isoform X1 [Tursiops truncatus]XP_019779646.1 nuclear respiratory factor 1 isoform X1 [Tursiops truncatus]XP_019779654.1 nuclear respiratory factor 1 isoform X1 [Tursiops truncatus]XP_019779656.1 nuclear respiratory factor 1 isoform X1 [Tursiops truncatus]XP_019779665.1 nuclear respiratory factor 1 isoform X1 [Tursiops truncatus]XP_026957743.1 nuclear respiratory factor 1 isoform X1 [Lagenorhynchus obliquidens]XP_026957744.1 nuclear respiratory factor 1 isoform